MDIVFAGICCWVDSLPPKTGKTVIIRNALGGGVRNGATIPPHTAFIHVKRDQVEATNWGSSWAGSDDNLLFLLTGDFLTFSPVPSGGHIDISLLPHVFQSPNTDPICPSAEAIRSGFLDSPTASDVLGLVDIPASASVHCAPNENRAIYAILRMSEERVTITATPFPGSGGVQRSLTITDPDARVYIANVNMPEYLIGVGAEDDDHRYLVCDIFERSASAARRAQEGAQSLAKTRGKAPVVDVAAAHAAELERVTVATLRRAAGRRMHSFLDSLAAGCSDSQWP